MSEFQKYGIPVIAVLERGVPNTDIESQLVEAGEEARKQAKKECGSCEYELAGSDETGHRRIMNIRHRMGLC